MKKLIFTLMAALCLTVSTFAADRQPSTPKWEGNINIGKLSKYLNLSSTQVEEVANITNFFSSQMERATRSSKDQDKKLRNAVYGNLKLMRKTLTPEQYAKYTQLINVTLKNRGIELEK